MFAANKTIRPQKTVLTLTQKSRSKNTVQSVAIQLSTKRPKLNNFLRNNLLYNPKNRVVFNSSRAFFGVSLGLWCNGSTRVSKTLSLGSNPSRPAKHYPNKLLAKIYAYLDIISISEYF